MIIVTRRVAIVIVLAVVVPIVTIAIIVGGSSSSSPAQVRVVMVEARRVEQRFLEPSSACAERDPGIPAEMS